MRQKVIKTGIHTLTGRYRQKVRGRDTHIERQAERQTHRLTFTHTNVEVRQIVREDGRQTDINTNTRQRTLI